MQVYINGEQLNLEPTTILDYLVKNAIDPRLVAVELNMDIIRKSEYASTRLREGDKMEIVHFVGGG